MPSAKRCSRAVPGLAVNVVWKGSRGVERFGGMFGHKGTKKSAEAKIRLPKSLLDTGIPVRYWNDFNSVRAFNQKRNYHGFLQACNGFS